MIDARQSEPQSDGTEWRVLNRNWNFVASTANWKKRVRRVQSLLLHRCPRPSTVEIKAVFSAPRWSVFFAYCPHGKLSASQRFSVQRLRDLGAPLMVIAASPSPGLVPSELKDLSDALYWKSLPGYDFSAYTIALEVLAAQSTGANVFVMNDSVFGPFHDPSAVAFSSPWDLTGWTACAKFENHLQSYALSIKGVDSSRLRGLRTVFFKHFALNEPMDVITCQETRLARVASKQMTVGACWMPSGPEVDATLELPFELLRAGLPFLKAMLIKLRPGTLPATLVA